MAGQLVGQVNANKRALLRLGDAEAMALLAKVLFGRFIFIEDGDPAVRTLNHVVDDGAIIVRTHAGAAITTAIGKAHGENGLRVAYQADDLDATDRLGWTVTVTGTASVVTDQDSRRYEALLRPWLDKTNDTVIAIQPTSVAGFRIVAGTDVAGTHTAGAQS